MNRFLPTVAGLAFSLFFSAVTAFGYTTPALPQINTNNIINVTNATYGAKGDGVTTNTTAIQNAINAAAAGHATNGLSGGTVEVPPGIYICGPLVLSNTVNLQLDAGAVLRLLPFGQYPGGIVNPANFISANNYHDIEISGSGAIDGQGAPWWPYANTNGAKRPSMICPSGCSRFLIQDITMSNSPQFHIALGGSMANVTIQHLTIRAPSSEDPLTPGHNTDACDVSGTNILVQNNNISVGDDNFTCGGNTSDVLITNNTYGAGHGVSIGSYTSPGVSNITVINCTFNGTDQGIRIKTDRDRGGLVRNISYYNLSMTNVMRPILMYCQYTNTNSIYRALDSITPSVAASYPVMTTSTEPRYRDIIISNVTATTQSGHACGLIWGLPESWMTNITLQKVTISASQSFSVYEATNVQLIDCKFTVPSGVPNIQTFNSTVTISNSTPSATLTMLGGLDGSNSLAVYGAPLAMTSSDLFAASPLTVSGCVLSNSGSLTLPAGRAINFALGTNSGKIVVSGGLTLNSTINITNADGFGTGNYTLFTYTSGLSGTPVLGATPSGFNYNLDTSTFGQVNLNVSPGGACTNPTANVTGSAAICAGNSTVVSAALTGTQPWKVYWSDGAVQNGVHNTPLNRTVSPASTTTYTVTNLTDATGCPVGAMTGGAVVTVNPHPTAAVSGSAAICAGSSALISATLSGSPPWNVTWSDSFVQNGVAASPATRSVSPSAMTVYSVTGLTDSNCVAQAGDLSGSATVTVNPVPSAVVSGGGTVCGGDSASVSAALSGTPPWNLTWSDGFVQTGVTTSPATRSVSPSATTNYTVTALSDSTGCPAGTLSGNALVTVNAHPTASVSGGGTICGGGPVGIQAALTGAQPWSVTWSDGFVQSSVTNSPATRNVSPSATTNYTVTALADSTGCSAGTLSGSAHVTVNPLPTAVVSGNGTICAGSSNTIMATIGGSAGPWQVSWSDGQNQIVSASPATRMVSPPVTTTYSINSVSDVTTGCTNTATGSAQVLVNPLPTAVVSGGGTVCNGSSNAITATLGGSPGPWSVTWSDGTNQVAASSPVMRAVSPSVTTAYTVTALTDITTGCTNAATGSALVTVCTNSPFQIVSAQLLNPDQFVLTWPSVSNSIYQVQSKDSLNAGTWTTNATITATNSTTSWTNTGVSTTAQRFFRVVYTP